MWRTSYVEEAEIRGSPQTSSLSSNLRSTWDIYRSTRDWDINLFSYY